jgi:hypothetical protein
MNAPDLTDIDVLDVNSDKVIDVNRHSLTDICTNKDRLLYNSTFRSKPSLTQNFICRNLYDMEDDNENDIGKKGKFDYIKVYCLGRLQQLFTINDHSNITPHMEDYDVVVIGLGTHDALDRPECQNPKKTVAGKVFGFD